MKKRVLTLQTISFQIVQLRDFKKVERYEYLAGKSILMPDTEWQYSKYNPLWEVAVGGLSLN